MVAGALGYKLNSGSGIDLHDIVLLVLVVILAIGALSLLLWALPKVYHVIFIWAACILISLADDELVSEQPRHMHDVLCKL